MSICDRCIHDNICGAEGVWDPGLTYCRDFLGWVPVSEGLPNLDDYTGSQVWHKKVLITGYLSFDNKKDLFVSEVFTKDVICNCVPDTVVLAWMPLPKPYKSESEERK